MTPRTVPTLLALATIFTLTGCSFFIANSGISNLNEIPAGLTRQEVQHRFGDPASSATCNDGQRVETYRIRRKLVQPGSRAPDWWAGWVQPMGYLLTFPLMEPFFLTPIMLTESERQKYEVAFIYGADERVLDYHRASARPNASEWCASLVADSAGRFARAQSTKSAREGL